MAFLSVDNKVLYDNVITEMEYHTHMPYASNSFKNNDEIRIPISQQDIITAPFDSYIVIEGKVSGKKADGTAIDVSLVNNAMAFLFEEIRYEINGKEIDRTRNVGITSTIKSLLSARGEDENYLKNACFFGPSKTHDTTDFVFSVPLRLLLGFAEDYRKVLINVKQELILLRAATDNNAVIKATAAAASVEITRLYWRIQHVTVSDAHKLQLYKITEKDTPLYIPYRSWELHEYPSLPKTKSTSWTIKTSSHAEKPRYVILAFQTARKNQISKDMSEFDHCKLSDVKLYLNSKYYPYDNIRGNYCLFYEMFSNFQQSYYGKRGSPIVDFADFKSKCPLFVIDCSKQDDALKTSSVDVRIDMQTAEDFPENTTAYCLIIHDSLYTYTPLTGDVRKITV